MSMQQRSVSIYLNIMCNSYIVINVTDLKLNVSNQEDNCTFTNVGTSWIYT